LTAWSVLAAMNDPATGRPGAMATATAASIRPARHAQPQDPQAADRRAYFPGFLDRGRPLRKRWSR
jgi:hypothetical protein